MGRKRVYPRAYGETGEHRFALVGSQGLSPRLRGNLAGRHEHVAYGGSIPALTGKPTRRRPPVGRKRVYPRAYGETVSTWRAALTAAGLSPRLRGNRLHLARGVDGGRSIPALTGKPANTALRSSEVKVYPRAYGETWRGDTNTWRTAGLSPRLRGNRQAGDEAGGQKGSIPALTGKPTRRRPPRGQKKGLSPRLRGNRLHLARGVDGGRSIPALTGKPHVERIPVPLVRVYPRAYGETKFLTHFWQAAIGLSPRLRGNHEDHERAHRRCGSIPALTGKPQEYKAVTLLVRVYPRAYGETRARRGVVYWRMGLSPRLRGNHRRAYCDRYGHGSIPALTGKPRAAGGL